MNTREIDLNPSVEEALARVNDGEGDLATHTYTNGEGKLKTTVTFSITVDALKKRGNS